MFYAKLLLVAIVAALVLSKLDFYIQVINSTRMFP